MQESVDKTFDRSKEAFEQYDSLQDDAKKIRDIHQEQAELDKK